jgi:SAM-dependent methyltransferase
MDYTSVSHQQAMLAQNLEHDFRATNLARLVQKDMIPGKVLDVGCGTGALILYLRKSGMDIHGIDIDKTSIARLKEFLVTRGEDPNRVSTQCIHTMVAAGFQYDNVISIDCLEHVEDDRKLFDGIFQATRINGRIIIIVPALMSLYGEKDRGLGHYRRYEKDTLLKLIADYPIKIERLRYWSFLGMMATYLSQRILKKEVDESFRFGQPTLGKKITRGLLDTWFRYVENPLPFPRGLSLVLTLTRLGPLPKNIRRI